MAMDRRKIIDGLKASFGGPFTGGVDREPEFGVHCLAPEVLAAILDRVPEKKITSAHLAHLADCPFCLQQLSHISRSREEEAATGLASEWLLQAEALGVKESGARQVRGWPLTGGLRVAAAVAATLVLAVGIVLVNFRAGSPVDPDSTEFLSTRNADTGAMNPRVLAPAAGSLIVPVEQVFRWTEVPGSLFYDVCLIDPDGELLLRERVETTRWLIPVGLHLQAGGEYYVRIDAYLDDERFLSSEHVVFSVSDDP